MAEKARKHVKTLFLALIATTAMAAVVVATGGSGILFGVLATLIAIELLAIGAIADRGLSLDCTQATVDGATEARDLQRGHAVRHAA